MLSASALNPEVAQHMLDNGAVGALLNAIRMNPNNPKVQCSSVNVLLALGKSIGATLFIRNGTFHWKIKMNKMNKLCHYTRL